MRLLDVETMREVEAQANSAGTTYAEMMQRAGTGLAESIDSTFGSAAEKRALGLVGAGNNGGDTLIALAWLAQKGWQSTAYLAKQRFADDAALKDFLEGGGKLLLLDQDADFSLLENALEDATVLLDGLLGTGFQMPLKPELAMLLSHIKSYPALPHVVAVDCPSGVDCVTGATAPEAIPAELTVCMAAVKQGLLQFPAYPLAGRIEVVDLGLDENLPAWADNHDEVVTETLAGRILPNRPLDAHKGSFGTAVLAVGSINYTGAALLSGQAALRSGVGLVRMAVPGALHGVLAGHLPEAVWTILPSELGVISADAVEVLLNGLEGAGALLIGCGWGREETTAEFLRHLLAAKPGRFSKPAIGFVAGSREESEKRETRLPPLVVDADGLRLLARLEKWPELLPPGSVLTPHPGEMAELCGVGTGEIQKNRLEIAREYAQKWNVVLVLKGALTVIANPEGAVRVIPVATSALAHAGTGDVLAGLITGFLAQGLPADHASTLAAWLHAQAGLVAEEWAGHAAAVTAGEVVDALGDAYQILAGGEIE